MSKSRMHFRSVQSGLHAYPMQVNSRVSVREDERRRIAHDLHDAIGQDLIAVILEMNRLSTRCEAIAPTGDSAELGRSLENLSARLEQIARAISDVSHQLHPIVLERIGLLRALRQLCDDTEAKSRIQIVFRGNALDRHVPWTTSLCLYRAAQEALHNVEKHSHAKRAEVSLETRDHSAWLTICDDGIGYDPLNLRPNAGLGLQGMREHVSALGGSLIVKTSPGRGTEMTVQVSIHDRN